MTQTEAVYVFALRARSRAHANLLRWFFGSKIDDDSITVPVCRALTPCQNAGTIRAGRCVYDEEDVR